MKNLRFYSVVSTVVIVLLLSVSGCDIVIESHEARGSTQTPEHRSSFVEDGDSFHGNSSEGSETHAKADENCGASENSPIIDRVPGGPHHEVCVELNGSNYKLAMPPRKHELCDQQRIDDFVKYVERGGKPHFFYCGKCRKWLVGKSNWQCCQDVLGAHAHSSPGS